MNPKKAKALRRAVREILKQPNGKEMLAPEGLAKAGRRAVRVVERSRRRTLETKETP